MRLFLLLLLTLVLLVLRILFLILRIVRIMPRLLMLIILVLFTLLMFRIVHTRKPPSPDRYVCEAGDYRKFSCCKLNFSSSKVIQKSFSYAVHLAGVACVG